MGVNADRIITDDNLQEIFEYPNPNFPLIVWEDEYERFPKCTVDAHWHDDFEIALIKKR